jgi:MYXO-CTERM domain-containing protein
MHRALRSAALWSLPFLALTAAASSARADTYEIREGDDPWARLRTLAPGDEVIVHAGTYAQPSRFEAAWAGTEAMPIVVRAAEGEARPVLTRDAAQNLLNLSGSHFTLRGFELVGGSHGIRLGSVSHATLEDLVIHGTGDVGISCNIGGNVCDHLVIRGCEIYETSGTGEGMYLGCNDSACTVSSSTIEGNYVHDLGGSQGDGIELKQGSFGNVIADNVIVRASYPGITVYSYEEAAGRTPNVIARNLVWGTADNGIQVTGHARVHNNVVVGAGASGIASQPNQDTPTDVDIRHNTVVGAGDSCVRANSWDTGTDFFIVNNALYCEGARAIRIASATTATVAGNVVLGAVEGTSGGFVLGAGLAADLGPEAARARVYPPAGSALLGAGDAAYTLPDDFDRRARGASVDSGAYAREASGMPAWLAEEGFKVLGVTPPAPDAGVAADAAMPADLDAAVPPGVDAGLGASDAATTRGDAGGTVSASGCGCRVEHRSTPVPLALLALLGVALHLARRRRHGRDRTARSDGAPRR